MDICNKHLEGDIVYDGNKCPMCEFQKQYDRDIEDYKDKISDLENKIDELEEELEKLNDNN